MLNAKKGAEIANREQTEELKREELRDKRLLKSMEKVKPVTDLVKAISQIDGIDVGLRVGEQYDRVFGTLRVKEAKFSVIVDTDEYMIYKQQPGPSDPFRAYQDYEGVHNLDSAKGAIAMICGYHYPDKAALIDAIR